MCGVIGYAAPEPSTDALSLLSALLRESRIRGLHAFGFTARVGETQETHKAALVSEIADKVGEFVWRVGMPRLFLAHCRYSTSGDWRDLGNNQPLDVGGISLAFNGVLSMETKSQMEQAAGCSFETENDGEIFLRHLLAGGDAESFLRKTRGSFAGLWLHNGRLYAARNPRRPLWILEQGGATFVASTQDIFQRAGFCAAPVPIEPYTVLCLSDGD